MTVRPPQNSDLIDLPCVWEPQPSSTEDLHSVVRLEEPSCRVPDIHWIHRRPKPFVLSLYKHDEDSGTFLGNRISEILNVNFLRSTLKTSNPSCC